MSNHKTIQNFKTKRYEQFPSYEIMWKAYSMIPNPLKYHNEVIFEGPQKMRIDIDCNEVISDDEWIKCLKECYNVFKEVTNQGNLVVYDMSDEYKRSCHMICYDKAYINNIYCKTLCSLIMSKIDNNYAKYIDENIYGKLQHFRMELSYKYGTNRCKIRTHTDNNTWHYSHGLIGYVEGLDIIGVSIEVPNYIHCDTDIVVKSNWCSVRKVNGNMIELTRHNPSYCYSCRRIHESENPYLIVKGNTSFLYCRRSKEPTLFSVKEKIVQL